MVSLALSQSALQSWMRPERIRQLANPVNVLLAVWLAWLLADLSWLLIPSSGTESAPVTAQVPVPAPATGSPPRIDERQIASWHLFGEAGKTAAAPVRKSTLNAPETRLKLTLRGVFASDEGAQARAIIGDPRGKENSYSLGDPLPGGATLSEIHPDRIILERNGRFETLRLPKQKTSGVSAARRGIRPATSGSAGKAAAFSKYRAEIKQNPASFLNYVRATPARQNGKFIGFRLQAGKQRGALKELGLMPGDIVTQINGVQIDSPARGMKAMQALSEGSSVNITLLRGGQETSMSLTLPSSGR
ncbi:MAG TPA: type II secretion system protein GspC [Gammaproteobacteria bacterium]|nr:type II secretion system protein GspC [Gammaproteobacteria bacterium]